jgi:hypothetical protein
VEGKTKHVAPWDIIQVRKPYKIKVGPLAKAPDWSKVFQNPFDVPGFAVKSCADGDYVTLNMDASDLPQFKLEFSFLSELSKVGSMTAWFRNSKGRDIMFSESFRLSKPPFPDGTSQAQIYFNAREKYVEMEVTGRMMRLSRGRTSNPVTILCNYGYARPVVKG